MKTKGQNGRIALTGVAAASLVLAPQLAVAQDTPADQQQTDAQKDDDGKVEKVVVTATKRSTALQKTPIAITAIGGKALKDQGAYGLQDVVGQVPGLQYKSIGGAGLSRVTIRGLSSVSGAATVSVYFDETPVTSPVSQQTQPDFSLIDIERIEVLRGPQGTLWGEGAVGGTIRYITNKPDTTEFTTSFGSELGTIRGGDTLFSANAVVNIPIETDRAALRVVTYYRDQGGWIDNARTGEEDTNDAENYGVRGLLSITPSERFSILGSFFYDNLDSGALPVQPNPGAQQSAVDDFRKEKYLLGSVRLGYQLDGAEIVSISSYLDRPRDLYLGTPSAGLDGFLGDPAQSLVTAGTNDITSFTQEVRLVSTSDSPLQYTIGGFYKDTKRDFFTALAMSPEIPAGTFIPGTGDLFNIASVVNYVQWAAFGELTYAFDEHWTILGGLRYTHETVGEDDINNNGAFSFPPLIPLQQLLSSSKAYEAITPKVTISYDVNADAMLYATAAQGFRAGGNNMQFPGTPFQSYEEDSAWNYEFGWKTAFAGGKVILNGAVYYIAWTDLQALGDPVPGSALGGRAVENIGDAHTAGLELEMIARLAPGLTWTANANWTEAKLDKDTNASSNDKGNTLPQVPKFTLGSTFNYEFPITGSIEGRLGASLQYVGERFQNIGNTFKYDSYTLLDLQAAVLTPNDWAITLFASNVTDETVFFEASGEVLGNYVNRPRTIGLRVSKDF